MLDDKELKLSEEQLKIACFALSSYINSLQKTLDSLKAIDDPTSLLVQIKEDIKYDIEVTRKLIQDI